MITRVVCPGCQQPVSVSVGSHAGLMIECGGEGEGSCCRAGGDGSTVCDHCEIAHEERADIAAAFERARLMAMAVIDAVRYVNLRIALDMREQYDAAKRLAVALLAVTGRVDPEDVDVEATSDAEGRKIFLPREATSICAAWATLERQLGEAQILRAALHAYWLRDHEKGE